MEKELICEVSWQEAIMAVSGMWAFVAVIYFFLKKL